MRAVFEHLADEIVEFLTKSFLLEQLNQRSSTFSQGRAFILGN